MARTAERPLPRGRMTGTQALVVGCAGAAGGLVYLAVACGLLFAGLAALACLLYVVVYTLLKPLTPWQTPIGALAGALPVLMGAALGSDVGSVMSTTLFGIAYFWQFPHAMAVAWLYRSEYALAGVKVAPVVEPTGRLAGWIAAGGAAALLATSLAPSVAQLRGWPYGVVAATLGTAYLLVSLHFLVARNDRAARRLFRASLVCLPVLLIALSVTGP